MLKLAPHKFGGAEIDHIAGAEHRFVVARPERIETPESGDQFGSDFTESEIGVDFVGGFELRGENVGRHIFFKAACEFGDILLFERQPHGIGVTAEILEQIACGINGGIDVEALHRSRRAGGKSVGKCQHHRRLIIKLGKARCHDAYDAFVPVFVEDYNRLLVAAGLDPLREDCVGLLGDAPVKLLAVLVILVDVAGFLICVGDVAAYQQIHSLAAALHAARSVDARADFEYYVGYGDLFAGEAADADYGSQTHVGIGVETPQPVESHHAVFIDHRNDVSCDRHGHQVEHPFEVGLRDAVADGERLHQFISHATPRQVRARIG